MSRRNGRNKTPPNIESMVSLKVDNLSYNTTTDDLKRYFSKYGEVGDIYIPRNPFTMASRGFAFVRYFNEREAEKAIDNLNGKEIDGRDIRICHARYNRPGSVERRNRYKSPRRRRSRSESRSKSRSRQRNKRVRTRSRSRSNRRSRSRSGRRNRSRSQRRTRSRSVRRSRSRSAKRSRSGPRKKSRDRNARKSRSYSRSRSSRSRS